MRQRTIRTAETLPTGERLIPRQYIDGIIAECLADAEYANEVIIPVARRAGIEHLTKEQILAFCDDATGLTETRNAAPHPVKYPFFLTYRGGKMTLDRREFDRWVGEMDAPTAYGTAPEDK